MKKINKQPIYNFYGIKNKWLGIIDYKSLMCLVIYIFIIFKISMLFNFTYIGKINFIIYMIIPVLVLFIFNMQEESIVDKLYIITKFILKRKIYVKNRKFAKIGVIYKKNR